MSIMSTYASCVVYVLPPTPLTCALREWAPPMCLALCYAVLLVKAMHLRALVAVGVGGQVSPCAWSFLSSFQALLYLYSTLLCSVFRYPLIHSLIPGIPEQPSHLTALHSRCPGSTVLAGPCWGNRGWGGATGQTKQCFCWPGMWPKTLGHAGYKNISCVLASSESCLGCC